MVGLDYVVMRALQLVIKSTGGVQTCNHEQQIFEGASRAGIVSTMDLFFAQHNQHFSLTLSFVQLE